MYTEYKGGLNILLCIVNFIFSVIRNNLLLEQIKNSEKSNLKKHKGKVIFMIKGLNKMFILFSIAQISSMIILQGTDSMFLYLQYLKANNRL